MLMYRDLLQFKDAGKSNADHYFTIPVPRSKNGGDYVLLGAPQPLLYPTPAPGSLPLFSHSWRVLF